MFGKLPGYFVTAIWIWVLGNKYCVAHMKDHSTFPITFEILGSIIFHDLYTRLSFTGIHLQPFRGQQI